MRHHHHSFPPEEAISWSSRHILAAVAALILCSTTMWTDVNGQRQACSFPRDCAAQGQKCVGARGEIRSTVQPRTKCVASAMCGVSQWKAIARCSFKAMQCGAQCVAQSVLLAEQDQCLKYLQSQFTCGFKHQNSKKPQECKKTLMSFHIGFHKVNEVLILKPHFLLSLYANIA